MHDVSPLSCEIEGRVAFYELDVSETLWHGHYFNYFENARQALLTGRGVDLWAYCRKHSMHFPIIRTSTTHYYPLCYKDVFICRATLAEARTRIIFDFEIRLKDSGRLCVKGRTEQAAVKIPEREILIFIPEEIRNALQP